MITSACLAPSWRPRNCITENGGRRTGRGGEGGGARTAWLAPASKSPAARHVLAPSPRRFEVEQAGRWGARGGYVVQRQQSRVRTYLTVAMTG